jgi:tetratricopeptide (TPR) repeat protein
MPYLVSDPVETGTEAPRLLAELDRHRFEDQYHLVRSHRRFASPELCELLCQECARLTAVSPDRAVEFAELAVLVADVLKAEHLSTAGLYQLRGYAWAHDANARRVLGDLRNADESFSIAESWWDAGALTAGDVLGYEPVILDLKASLRISQRRFGEAFETLDRLVAIHTGGSRLEHRDAHLAGRALVVKALGHAEMGEPELALQLLEEAAPLLDAQRDPRLFLCLRHNLLWNLTTIGDYTKARRMQPEVAALCQELGNPLDLMRLRWAEARIAAGLCITAGAIELFQSLRRDFAALGISYDAALVTLELTALYAQTGDLAQVKRLSLEMAGIFQAQDVPREALAALLFFQKAAERERATAKLAREIGAFLEKLRCDPDLRFESRR